MLGAGHANCHNVLEGFDGNKETNGHRNAYRR